MKPPIEEVTDKIEFATRINKCIDTTTYFAEQFFGYNDIFFYNREFLNCTDRFIVARYGRQSGKTKNVSVKAIHFGYFAPVLAPHLENEHTITVLCVSQSEEQARIIFKNIRNWIHSSKILSKTIQRETKTEIVIKSFDGEKDIEFIVRPTGETGKSVRGFTAALMIIDEATYIPDAVFNALLPAGSAVQARVYVLSTPAEKAGTFYEICESSNLIYKKDTDGEYKFIKQCEKDDDHVWTQFHVSSWDNPRNKTDVSFLNMIKKYSKTKQKAELEAEFLDAGASLFSADILNDAFTNIETTGDDISYYDLGVDTSGKGTDETVLIDIAITKSGMCYPIEVYTEETTDQTLLARKIEHKYRRRRYKNIYVDSTAMGAGLVDACKHVITPLPIRPVTFTQAEKIEIYNGLVILFENRKINFTKFPEEYLIKCRQQLQYMYADYGLHGDSSIKIRTHADHDDFPDSLALGCYSQYSLNESWHTLSPDIVDPDYVVPLAKQIDPVTNRPKKDGFWIGHLRLGR